MSPDFDQFWRERHLCTLTTVRPDGTPHVVPVGATYDAEAGVIRVITSGASRKARNVLATGRAVVCQVDGRRWTSVEGAAIVHTEPSRIADAERRYAERYRTPRANPERVVIEIRFERVLGTVR
ncbi:pyridoxamine 5'-phosphate oxidase family protein [Actinokineospora diospyrosa]|uniref:PPOX class probable F420-dependent enzyme n=1 Tax=Actinokineospora diospyrosa TaxID=103728 RepID=A0ABT1IFZ7_9PSEU|nr:TIGR03618 family F420-dependent PPOX class oxidoreductase [Actinokineospora diospyrosa]MCP2271201.1 PPOX class probable F420-dependent enzyme [Actinokineospora diospyrosa]